MSGLRISPELTLPRDTVTSTLIIYGGKGMGKTNLGRVLVEELTRAHLRWSALDPLGVWWGVRHSGDGKGPGIECLILGGIHGDIPIEPTGGAVVADLVVDESVNVIIDFSRKRTGETWSLGEKIRFCTDYALRVFQRQGEMINGRRREPLFQLLDEAARYIPQLPPRGDFEIAKCVGAWNQIVEEGRNFGIGVGLLTQRSARMNKSVSELADAMIAFRTVGPNSIEAIMEWLGEHIEKAKARQMIETIRQLERGHALVVSPGWLKFEGVVPIRLAQTFDSSATPEAGGKHTKEPTRGAKPDLAKYQERMAATIERAKAEDPRELRAKIAKLEKELSKAGSGSSPSNEGAKHAPAAADPAAIARAVEKAIAVERHRFAVFVRHVDGLLQRMNNAQADHHATVSRLVAPISIEATALSDLLAAKPVVATVHTDAKPPKPETAKALGQLARAVVRHIDDAPRVSRASTTHLSGDHEGSLPKGEKAVLAAIAQYPNGVYRNQLTVLTGYKKSSRDSYIGRLRERGYIDVLGDGRIVATEAGIAALGNDYEPPLTGEARREKYLRELPEGESKVLKLAVDVYDEWIPRETVTEETGYKKSSRDSYIGRLRARELIETGPEGIRASKDLF